MLVNTMREEWRSPEPIKKTPTILKYLLRIIWHIVKSEITPWWNTGRFSHEEKKKHASISLFLFCGESWTSKLLSFERATGIHVGDDENGPQLGPISSKLGQPNTQRKTRGGGGGGGAFGEERREGPLRRRRPRASASDIASPLAGSESDGSTPCARRAAGARGGYGWRRFSYGRPRTCGELVPWVPLLHLSCSSATRICDAMRSCDLCDVFRINASVCAWLVKMICLMVCQPTREVFLFLNSRKSCWL